MTRSCLATLLTLVLTGSAAWAQFPTHLEKDDYKVFSKSWEDTPGAVVSPDGTPGLPAHQATLEPLNNNPPVFRTGQASQPVVVWSSQAPVTETRNPPIIVTTPMVNASAPPMKVTAPAVKVITPPVKVTSPTRPVNSVITPVVQLVKPPAPVAFAMSNPVKVGNSPYSPAVIAAGGPPPLELPQPQMIPPTFMPIPAGPAPITTYPVAVNVGAPSASCPSGNCHHSPCSHGGCRHGCDLRRIWDWLTYHPIKSHACTGKFCTPACQPGLYEFFLPCPAGCPPRIPGCASCGHH
jgi:hypothetical protein